MARDVASAGGARPGALDPPTEGDARAPDSVRDLERAIVAATLAGRHATAELLADQLRERLADRRDNVVRVAGARGRGHGSPPR